MKLKFTRKTWYFFLLAAAAVTLLNGLAVMAGSSFSLLEQIAFCMTGITALFLAAQKGAPAWEKRAYFGVFVLLMLEYIFSGAVGYVFGAAVWPALLAVEIKRGAPVTRPAQAVGYAESLHLLFVLTAVYGNVTPLRFWANVLWVLLACARGWAALILYKNEVDEE